MFALTQAAYADDTYVVRIDGARVRKLANRDADSTVLGELSLGDKVKVLEKSGRWLKIKASSGGEGWVNANLLRPAHRASSAATSRPSSNYTDAQPVPRPANLDAAPAPKSTAPVRLTAATISAAVAPKKTRKGFAETGDVLADAPVIPPAAKAPVQADVTPIPRPRSVAKEIAKDEDKQKPEVAKPVETKKVAKKDAKKKTAAPVGDHCVANFNSPNAADKAVLNLFKEKSKKTITSNLWASKSGTSFDFAVLTSGVLQMTLKSLPEAAIHKIALERAKQPNPDYFTMMYQDGIVRAGLSGGYVTLNASFCKRADDSFYMKLVGTGSANGKKGQLELTPSPSGITAVGTLAGTDVDEKFSAHAAN